MKTVLFNSFQVLFKETFCSINSIAVYISVGEKQWIDSFNCWEVAWHVYVTDLLKHQISHYMIGQFLYARYDMYIMESVKTEVREGCPSRITVKNIIMSSPRELMLKTVVSFHVSVNFLCYQCHINLAVNILLHLLLVLWSCQSSSS
jgi:hypothetical protein